MNKANIESLDNFYADSSSYHESNKLEKMIGNFSKNDFDKLSKLYNSNISTAQYAKDTPKGKIHMDKVSIVADKLTKEKQVEKVQSKMLQQNLVSIKQEPNKNELDALKDELSTLKAQNKGLKSKFETVEKFFSQDKVAMKRFNQYLNNDKELNSPEKDQEKELTATKKVKKGIEL